MPELRPYQLEDAERIARTASIGVFSEQRTGKTPTVIRGLMIANVIRPLIICPNSIKLIWKSEFETWSNMPATVINSLKDVDNYTSGAIIINYEMLRATKKTAGLADRLLKIKPDAVVVDEAHRIKTVPTRSIKAFTTKAVWKFIKCPRRIAITGTPASNKPWEMYSILHFLRPDMFKSYYDFKQQYFEQEYSWTPNGQVGVPVRIKKEYEQYLPNLLDTLAIQRKRRDVWEWADDEPIPIKVRVPATKYQLQTIDNFMNWFESDGVMTQGVLDNLTMLRRVCNLPPKVSDSPKFVWVKEYIKDNPDKSILIFTCSTMLIHEWQEHLKEYSVDSIYGDVSLVDRNKRIADFQNNKIKVLLLQRQACKEGLTLDSADVTIFVDTFPPTCDYLQAKDRMVPVIPEHVKPQTIIHLMIADTYDEQLYNLVDSNVAQSAIINDYIYYMKERRTQ